MHCILDHGRLNYQVREIDQFSQNWLAHNWEKQTLRVLHSEFREQQAMRPEPNERHNFKKSVLAILCHLPSPISQNWSWDTGAQAVFWGRTDHEKELPSRKGYWLVLVTIMAWGSRWRIACIICGCLKGGIIIYFLSKTTAWPLAAVTYTRDFELMQDQGKR